MLYLIVYKTKINIPKWKDLKRRSNLQKNLDIYWKLIQLVMLLIICKIKYFFIKKLQCR